MCEQTVLRFFIALKETFYNSIIFAVIKKYDKAAVVQNVMVEPIYHGACRRVLWRGSF